MPSPTNATAADAARWNAARTILSNILNNGVGGALSVTGPLSGVSIPNLMLDTFEAILLALWQLSEASPEQPLQMPVFANAAALPSASTWPGGLVLVSSLGAAGQPAYSDGTNWRRVDNNSPSIP